MNFWDLKESESCAVIDQNSGHAFSYQQLKEQVNSFIELLPANHTKNLGMILCQNEIKALVAYLASLKKKDTAFLIDAKTSSNSLKRLILLYKPHWIFSFKKLYLTKGYKSYALENYFLYILEHSDIEHILFIELALLLSTSGATGSGKTVRLSYSNLASNACSIAEYLCLSSNDRTITSLPMYYSYGLSLINSTLQSGGTILLTNKSIVESSFWEFACESRTTSFAGVPFTYEILNRMKLKPLYNIPSLLRVMQAGGPLSHELALKLYNISTQLSWQFYIMYGQTEATARISYLPPEKAAEKVGSIGISIPRGQMSISLNDELVYQGPNVMLGYAQKISDLAKPDECQGLLYTGDIVKQDDEGYFFIVGRKNRFIKLLGLRLNLDELEKKLEHEFAQAIMCTGSDEFLFILIESEDLLKQLKIFIENNFQLPSHSYSVIYSESFPRTSVGKKDYSKALKLCIKNRRKFCV